MQGGITAGTVLGVLLPTLVALLCYASYVRNKNREDYRDPEFVRQGSRKINQFLRNRRQGSPETRDMPVGSGGGGGGGSSSGAGGKRTPDTQNSDESTV